jgi:hypothetical protein
LLRKLARLSTASIQLPGNSVNLLDEVYRDLSRRCLATMHEVQPLTQAPADCASLPVSDLRRLTGKR